jgi:hypothetical protein
MFGELESVDTNASRSSFAAAVEKAGVAIEVAALDRSRKLVASIAMEAKAQDDTISSRKAKLNLFFTRCAL